MSRTAAAGTALVVLAAGPMPAQTRVTPITESVATFGRGGAFRSNDNFIAGVVALADIGVQWRRPSGRGYGISLTGGRDFPNEATLLGLRVRASRPLAHGRVEGSVALIASSVGAGGVGHAEGLGGSVAVSYWPANWLAVTAAVDVIPTYPEDQVFAPSPQLSRRPALSVGVRLARWPAVATWIGAGLAATAWVLSGATNFGLGG